MDDKITTQWKGDLIFESLNPNQSTLTLGSGTNNDDNISGPKVLMLSSLAGCSGLDVISILEKMKIRLSDFKMNTSAELTVLNTEFESLEAEIHSISTNTQWNGRNILDGSLGEVSFHVGANANQTVSVTFADLNTDFGTTEASQAGSGANASGALDIFTNLARTTADNDSNSGNDTDEIIDLAAQVITGSAQSTTLGYIDTAITRVSSHRATLGAMVNRLEFAADNLTNISINTSTARSRILDTDYAEETSNLARTQIIQQAAMAVLAQANQHQKVVLTLLQ